MKILKLVTKIHHIAFVVIIVNVNKTKEPVIKPIVEPNFKEINNRQFEKYAGNRSGGTENTNIKRVTMDDDLVKVARDLDICLED